MASGKIYDTEFCEQSTSNAENISTEKWSILLDKEYFGLGSETISIIQKKKPINRILTATDKNRNKSLSRQRVIVENFF